MRTDWARLLWNQARQRQQRRRHAEHRRPDDVRKMYACAKCAVVLSCRAYYPLDWISNVVLHYFIRFYVHYKIRWGLAWVMYWRLPLPFVNLRYNIRGALTPHESKVKVTAHRSHHRTAHRHQRICKYEFMKNDVISKMNSSELRRI